MKKLLLGITLALAACLTLLIAQDDPKPADDPKPPAEEKKAEETPAEKPADKPAEEKKAEDKPADQPAVEEKKAEEKPADPQPAVEEKKAEDPKPEEKPADPAPVEEKKAEDKPADQPAVEKPAETKPAEAKPEKPAAVAPAPVALDEASGTLAKDESARRSQALIEARENLKKGKATKNFDEAITLLEKAYNNLPRNPKTDGELKECRRALISALSRAGNSALWSKPANLEEAKKHADRILQIESENTGGKRLLADIEKKREQIAKEGAPKTQVVKKTDSKKPKEPPTPANDPKWLDTLSKIKTLLHDGELAFQSGQYSLAEKKFQSVLEMDKYNADAYRSLAALHRAREKLFETAKTTVSAQRLSEATEAWQPVRRKNIRPDVIVPPTGGGSDTALINKKLREIVIPQINFTNADIKSVIDELINISKDNDLPEHVGVNIILNLPTGGVGGGAPAGVPGAGAGFAPAPLPPIGPAPIGGAGLEPLPVGDVGGVVPASTPGVPSITLKLSRVPLGVALDYITSAADLRYRVESHAVVITSGLVTGTNLLITKTYKVVPGTFENEVRAATAATGQAGTITRGTGAGSVTALGQGAVTITPADVKKFFTDAGIAFPPSSGVNYSRGAATLIVTNTAESLDAIERILEDINKSPPQIEIETRFVEVTQSIINELGFSWKIGPGGWNVRRSSVNVGNAAYDSVTGQLTPGSQQPITAGLRDIRSITVNTVDALLASQNAFLSSGIVSQDSIMTVAGVLTNPQLQVTLKALANNKAADLLSAPRVIATNGRQADIKIAREFIYPTDFTPATATSAAGGTAGGGAVAVVPATPGGFTTREVGVLLNVTPQVGEDKYTITLTLVPEVAEFDGFINYGGTIQVPSGASVVNVDNPILQPIFSTRKVTTELQIWDGQTVLIGGLIRDDRQIVKDKVPILGDAPLLGRFFRTNLESIVKRNLLIFVTASLIKPDGTRQNPDIEPESVMGTGVTAGAN